MPFFGHKPAGSKPVGSKPIFYTPYEYRLTMQDKWNWPWPSAVTQYGARVTSNWYGNQLPNSSVHIAGVPDHLWVFTRSGNMMHKQVQMNRGFNIQTSGLTNNAAMLQNIQTAWRQGGY